MKLLVIVPYYPHASHQYSGSFNERTVQILKNLCEYVEVLVPRPYTPQRLSRFSPRWRAYANIPYFEVRNGVSIYRPAYLTIPKVGAAIARGLSSYLGSRNTARKRHKEIGFDAILSFDLFGVGSLAWRIGKDLEIPSCGWGTGDDLAQPPGSMRERVLKNTLKNLDVVFYQSQELRDVAASLQNARAEKLDPQKHILLARGIGEPPILERERIRKHLQTIWGVKDGYTVIMSIGRAVREKGIFEFLKIVEKTRSSNDRFHFVWVGVQEGFDHSDEVRRYLNQNEHLAERVSLLPACHPDKVWEYLCAADMFLFLSHQKYEGMPNSLLEAMAMSVPPVAFDIPPIREIEGGTGALVTVEPFNTQEISKVLLRLVENEEERQKIGASAREQVMNRFLSKNTMVRVLNILSQIIISKQKSRDEIVFSPYFSPNK